LLDKNNLFAFSVLHDNTKIISKIMPSSKESILSFFEKMSQENSRCIIFSKMVCYKHILKNIKSMKTEICRRIGKTGHDTLFQSFIEHLSVNGEDVRGDKGWETSSKTKKKRGHVKYEATCDICR
jgi:hypothetical protein